MSNYGIQQKTYQTVEHVIQIIGRGRDPESTALLLGTAEGRTQIGIVHVTDVILFGKDRLVMRRQLLNLLFIHDFVDLL